MGVPPENGVAKRMKSGKDTGVGRGSKKRRLPRFVLDFGKILGKCPEI